MIFFTQKVLRTMPGNWTFVIVTDRDDLDEQAYKEFAAAGVVEEHTRATSSKHLRTLLREDRRYVFTLIQKFRTERGEQHPVLSDRDDVIVITDEAHRTQYDVLALNMRNALPNAGFIGFTGTPLIAGEEKTKEVFGDYVSVYNYASSTADGATVPLYFENRIPTLKLDQSALRRGPDRHRRGAPTSTRSRSASSLASSVSSTSSSPARIVSTGSAKDIVNHFLGRGFPGKAMVVSIDKATAVRTYLKVQAAWEARLKRNEERLASGKLDRR